MRVSASLAASARSSSASTPRGRDWRDLLCLLLLFWLGGSVLVYLVGTRHWPLVNDGALQHYISFLIDHGYAPYRQIQDMNLPGSLLLDWTVVHTLGPGPVAWRVFDGLLLLAAAGALLLVTGASGFRPVSWFPGLFAASLLALLHGRDGMGQAGQRDLSEAVLLLAATAFAFVAVRRLRPTWLLGFGLCVGASLTVKPDSVVLALILLALALREVRRRTDAPLKRYLLASFAGLLVPGTVVTLFLVHYGAARDCWYSLTEITPFYAGLGRLPFSALLRDCLPAPTRVLAASGLASAMVVRFSAPAITELAEDGRFHGWEELVLLHGTLWGLASFFLQGKGYPYHRYTALAFLLPLVACECTTAFRSQRVVAWVTGLLGLCLGAFVVAPGSLHRALHASWDQAHIEQLELDLRALHAGSTGNTVQCLDSISGCNTALLRLGVAEPTGMLSDFLVFGPATQPAVHRTQAAFLNALQRRPPRLLVVTSWLHPKGVSDYEKLALWPAFHVFLLERYEPVVERSFAPGPNGPRGYRIYRLKEPAQPNGFLPIWADRQRP